MGLSWLVLEERVVSYNWPIQTSLSINIRNIYNRLPGEYSL